MRKLIIALLLVPLCIVSTAAAQEHEERTGGPDDARVFAVVGDTMIPVSEFEANFHAGARERFYHRNVPEAEIVEFRKEVAESLIDRILLLQEVERRGVEPDESWIEEEMERLEERFSSVPGWEESRETARAQLLGDSVIARLKAEVEDVPAPEVEEVRAYYRSNPDKFTTPERLRVSLILLKVEPWATGAAWQAAHDEAQRLVQRLEEGEDFAALARLHSADDSATEGGDLGYVHEGMLAPEAQRVLDELAPGELSSPVQLLQGFAIFRLDERSSPVLNDFRQIEERARGLMQREMKEQAWEQLLADLRSTTRIEVNEAVVSTGD